MSGQGSVRWLGIASVLATAMASASVGVGAGVGATTAARPTHGHYATLRGIRLYYEVHGAGEHDVVRRDQTEAMARAIPHARFWIVPGASHSVAQAQPELVNRTVAEFSRR